MKQKDIALLIVIGFLSAIFALIIANATIGSPKNRRQKVEIVEKITTDFNEPDKRYFNSDSVNPTQLIETQNNTNTQPF